MKALKAMPTPVEMGPAIGIPSGKKFSVLNLAKAGSAPGAARKRKPKPGQKISSAYSY